MEGHLTMRVRPERDQKEHPLPRSMVRPSDMAPTKKATRPSRSTSMQAPTQAAMQAHAARAAAHGALALYEDARRYAVSLWRLKWQLWKTGQERFFKTSPVLRAIDRLCWSDPTCQIRALADASACRFADKHGDALFRKNVDGTELHSVTMWFYGRFQHQRRTQIGAEEPSGSA